MPNRNLVRLAVIAVAKNHDAPLGLKRVEAIAGGHLEKFAATDST